jgi:alkylation response protein AidB-like acyl-CoA dehydrogenase
MDYTLSEEQEMIKKTARDFLTDKCPTEFVREMEEDEKGYSPQLWQEMAGLGWMGLVFPEKYGGTGCSFLELAVLLEEMGYALLPSPFSPTVVLSGLLILDAGSEEQKQKYLPDIVKGEVIFTLALIESPARYDTASITVKATADNNDYILSGTKLFVPDAHVADYLLCVARTNEQVTPGGGLTIFIIDAKSPGIGYKVLKTAASDKLCEVTFEQVSVARGNILGRLDQGWGEVEKVIQWAAVAKCCEVVGIMKRILEMTVEYAKDRVRWHRAIGSFQGVQTDCARMLADIDGARLSTYQAAWRLSEGLPCRKEVAIAKAWMNQASERVLSRGHQIHGGIGLCVEHDLQLYTRRAKAAQPTWGDTDFYKEIVAEVTLK